MGMFESFEFTAGAESDDARSATLRMRVPSRRTVKAWKLAWHARREVEGDWPLWLVPVLWWQGF